MSEKISILTNILSAILTGGILMIFIESLHLSNIVNERLHQKLDHFFYRFTEYTKFISSFGTCFIFEHNPQGYMKTLKKCIKEISSLGGKAIIIGKDYPITYFTAEELNTTCETINNIWYYIDKDPQGFKDKVRFDQQHADQFCDFALQYMKNSFPNSIDLELNKDTLGKLSGKFYTDVYQPIRDILPEYEFWCKKETEFKYLAYISAGFVLIIMMLIALLECIMPVWIVSLSTLISCYLLGWEIILLIKLENISKKII